MSIQFEVLLKLSSINLEFVTTQVPWRHSNLEYDTWSDSRNLHTQFQGHVTAPHVATRDQEHVEVDPNSSLRAVLTEPVWAGNNTTASKAERNGCESDSFYNWN